MNKPTTWKDLYLDLPSAIGVHSQDDLQAIRSLTDGSINDDVPTAWYRLSREIDLLFLIQCTNGEIQVLHHLELIGDRQTKAFKAVALCGFNSNVPPVEINIEHDLCLCTHRIPEWDEFQNALESDDTEAFKHVKLETAEEETARITNLVSTGKTQDEAEATRAKLFQTFSVIAIPAGLAKILIESSDRDPASLALKFWNLMTSLDEDNEGETEGYTPFRPNFRHLIRFLWMATRNTLVKVPYVLSDKTRVQEWAERTHQAYLQPKHPFGAGNLVSPSQDTTALEKIAFSITSTLEDRLSHKSGTKEDENGEGQGFKKKFGPHLQQLFLNASAELPYEKAATEPSPTFERFLAQKTLGGAKTYLRGHLRSNPFLQFTPSAGLTTSMYTGNVQWDDTYTPRNFSIFFCGKHQSNNGPSSSYNDQALYLKEQLGNGINESEVKQILKQDKSCPKDAAELLDQIQVFLALCSFIFGENAKISMAMKTWVHHLNRNKASYDSMQRTDCTFLSQVLYCIDMAVQVHLDSCLSQTMREDVNDACLDFSTDQQNVTRRQFFITLPQSIKTLAQTVTPSDKGAGIDLEQAGGGGGGNGKINGLAFDQNKLKEDNYRKRLIQELENYNTPNLESKKVKNSNPVKTWLLQADESFGQVFQTKIKTCPKQDRSFVCLKYWIKGECFKNCKFVHADLKQETKQGITDWIAQCRSDFQHRGS